MKKIVAFIELVRIKHWIKNLLIFLPAICARQINMDMAWQLCLGFLSFSLLTSFVYIVNDLMDITKDRAHPRKKKRPLPSGRVSKWEALILAFVMLAGSLGLECLASQGGFGWSWALLAAYAIVNLGYSFGLKNMAIIDVVLLSAGFVIRIYYGAALAGVMVSNWLFLTILSASVFLALGKRKKELATGGAAVRKVLNKYNLEFLDKFMTAFLALIFVFYSLWAVEQDNTILSMTIPLIIVIFMRYCLDIEKTGEGDPTTIVYGDKVLLCLCLVYVILMGAVFVVL